MDLVLKQVSIYNTLMKIFFIASSLYILYLMRYKYHATYDAGLDTFRIEYLLVGSAILGVISTYIYTVVEVNKKKYSKKRSQIMNNAIDIMEFFYLVGSSGDFTSIVHVAENWRSRDNYNTLLVCFRCIPSSLLVELDL